MAPASAIRVPPPPTLRGVARGPTSARPELARPARAPNVGHGRSACRTPEAVADAFRSGIGDWDGTHSSDRGRVLGRRGLAAYPAWWAVFSTQWVSRSRSPEACRLSSSTAEIDRRLVSISSNEVAGPRTVTSASPSPCCHVAPAPVWPTTSTPSSPNAPSVARSVSPFPPSDRGFGDANRERPDSAFGAAWPGAEQRLGDRCMYNACMPNIQVRDVPEDVHAALVRRAALAGQSLQQYLAAQLTALAATPTLDEMLDRIAQRPKGRLSQRDAIAAVEDERARR